MAQKQNKLTQTAIVALLACVCCILWGSAIPVIKTGYHLLQVDSAGGFFRHCKSDCLCWNPLYFSWDFGVNFCINQGKENDAS